MSTYTDLHLRKKENLTVLRMPGNIYDGLTPQRVIFQNPENIYNGKFIGELSTTSAAFNNVTLTNCTIDGAIIKDATFKYGDEIIALTDLTTDQSLLKQAVEALQDFCTSANLSIQIQDLSTKQLSICVDELSNIVYTLSNASDSSISAIDILSNNISSLSDEFTNYQQNSELSIKTLFKQTYGGLTYRSVLSIDSIDVENRSLRSLFTESGLDTADPLSVGYFYIAKSQYENRLNHYSFDGVELENGDWLLIKNNCYVNTVTSNDVDVLDAQDYDTFKLPDDNVATGTNIFKGETTLSTTLFNGTVQFQQPISVNETAIFSNGLTSNSISSSNLSTNVAYIDKLNVSLSNVNYGISSFQDLSDDIYDNFVEINGQILSLSNDLSDLSIQFDSHIISAEQCIKSLSNDISSLSDDISYLSSELSNYHNTLSGIDSLNDVEHDIKSDNLILTNVLLPGGTEHHHQRYYMTFLSGTIVLKPIS